MDKELNALKIIRDKSKDMLDFATHLIDTKRNQQQVVDLDLSKNENLLSYSALDESLDYNVRTLFKDGENVYVTRHKSLNDDIIHLSCSMIEGAYFPPHTHDFYEYFVITKGVLKEDVSGSIISMGDFHILQMGSFHGFTALQDSFMEIICSRKPLTKTQVNVIAL